MSEVSLVSVVDDDESVRESLQGLLRAEGFRVATFASADAFLHSAALAETICVLLDVRMPRTSGPELQQILAQQRPDVRVVFITATDDDVMRRRVLRDGAVAFLLKPFAEDALLDALRTALGPKAEHG